MKLTYFKQGDKTYEMNLWEIHHYFTGYIGFIVCGLLSFYSIYYWADCLVKLFGFGSVMFLWIIADDWIQHYIQAKEMEKDGYYTTRSFWHWIFYKKYWEQ